MCLSYGLTEINTIGHSSANNMKKDGRMPRFIRVNGSIDLINRLGARDLSLSGGRGRRKRMSISRIGRFPFRQKWYKSEASRTEWKNWANPPEGKSGNERPGSIARRETRRRRVWQKTRGRRMEGFNKFLSRREREESTKLRGKSYGYWQLNGTFVFPNNRVELSKKSTLRFA